MRGRATRTVESCSPQPHIDRHDSALWRELAQQLRVDAVRATAAAGGITDDELMTYRQVGSRLEGHPTPRLPWVDVATGSLGLGLPVGVGIALVGKALDRLPYRVWVLTGDSELAEGSMWEAFARAAHAGLDNLITIVDVNRLGQSGETMLGWDTAAYAARDLLEQTPARSGHELRPWREIDAPRFDRRGLV